VDPRRVAASLIVRVVDGHDGRRIVVLDLRSKEVREFRTWATALEFVQHVAEEEGLR
jgi:hypothetical protein